MEDILVPITFFALVFGIVWVVFSTRLRSSRIHGETIGKLIDKLGSSQEAMAYLESASGQKLLDAITTTRSNPYARILGAAATGVVLCALGAGLVVFGLTFAGGEGPVGGGIIVLALGLGFLLASGLSYKLSKSWGLVNGASAASHGGGAEPNIQVDPQP